jgi:Spy/CpxP family protein refolding chaperone
VNARLAELERRLKITPEQKQRIRPIVESAGMHIRDIGGESYERIVSVAQETQEEISRELSPEQREEFNRLRPQVISILRDLTQREITVRSHKAGMPPPPTEPGPVSSRQK